MVRLVTRSSCTTTRCSVAKSARWDRNSTASATSAVMVGNQPRYYNGFTQEQVGGAYGLKKLGVHNVKPFFTRGILLDILALKGGERLPDRLRHHGR